MSLLKPLRTTALVCATLPASVLGGSLDYLDYNATQPYPAIEVSAQGNEFANASNAPINFQGQARGKCSWGWRAIFVSHTVDPDGTNTGQVYADQRLLESPNSKNMTWSSSWKPLSLDWNPSSSWRNSAVKACNARLKERLAQGESYQQIRAKDFDVVIQRDLWSGLHMQCSDYGLLLNTHHTFAKHPVVARCKGNTLVEPKPTVPSAGNIAPALSLSHVSLQSPKPNFQGFCPGEIPFTATVVSNGAPGKLQYRFLVDGKPVGGFKQLTLTPGKANTSIPYTVEATATAQPAKPNASPGFQMQAPGPQAKPQLEAMPSHTLKIEVKTAQQTLSAEADYSVTCKTLKAQVVAQTPAALPDLTALPPVTLGSKTDQWGGHIVLTPQDASAVTPRGCQFRFAYTAVNSGQAEAAASTARLRNDTTVIHQQPGIALAVDAERKVSGLVTLQPGQHLLNLALDDDKAVTESNEANNRFRLMVTVPNSCGGAEPNTPPGTPPGAPRGTPRPIPGALPQ